MNARIGNGLSTEAAAAKGKGDDLFDMEME